MDTYNLLNQNIKVVPFKTRNLHNKENFPNDINIQYDYGYKLINMSNGMELARFHGPVWTDCWINPGGFMNKEEQDKFREEFHKLNAEMINEE